MEEAMNPRWTDRIRIMKPGLKVYDSWGNLAPTEWEFVEERWACVCTNLSNTITALVSVKQPFDHKNDIEIEWQECRWRLTQGPLALAKTGLVHFKMEKLS
jgi:hypothetical protein